MFLIDKGLTFIYDEENIKMAATWVENGKIIIYGEVLNTPLTPEHRYSIAISTTSSRYFTDEQKEAVRAKAFEGDTSDKA